MTSRGARTHVHNFCLLAVIGASDYALCTLAGIFRGVVVPGVTVVEAP